MSGEHVVSQSIFSDEVVTVESGLSSIPAGKSVPLLSLKANILCVAHKGGLSDVDSEMGRLSGAIRGYLRSPSPRTGTIRVDGWRVERWCIKSTCNLLASRWMEPRPLILDPWIVKAAFGEVRFWDDAGLYLVKKPAKELNPSVDRVEWNLVETIDKRAVIGTYFNVNGLGLFITTVRGDPAAKLRAAVHTLGRAPNWSNAELTHRPRQMHVSFQRKEWNRPTSVTIKFDWQMAPTKLRLY